MAKYKDYGDSYYYGGSSNYYYGGTNYWKSWNSKFASYEDIFKKKEKRREMRKEFEAIAREMGIPLDLRLGGESSLTKRGKVVLNLDDNMRNRYKPKFRELMEFTDKLPSKLNQKLRELVNYVLFGKEFSFKTVFPSGTTREIIKSSIEGRGLYTIGQLESFLQESDKSKAKAAKEEDANSECYGNGVSKSGLTDKQLISTLTNKIKSKFYFPDVTRNEENYRKGNRIARGYMNGTSYKPLIGKTTIAHKKKKIMIVIDGSGSMCSCGQGEFSSYRISTISAAFSTALYNSGLFSISHVIVHTSGGWENILGDIIAGKTKDTQSGGEGFENIDDTIPESYPRQADYVLFLTDMKIGEESQTGIANFLKRAKRHMILSYGQGGDLEGLNVRKISSFNGMINGLSTLLA